MRIMPLQRFESPSHVADMFALFSHYRLGCEMLWSLERLGLALQVSISIRGPIKNGAGNADFTAVQFFNNTKLFTIPYSGETGARVTVQFVPFRNFKMVSITPTRNI